jgi:hypothetical protein
VIKARQTEIDSTASPCKVTWFSLLECRSDTKGSPRQTPYISVLFSHVNGLLCRRTEYYYLVQQSSVSSFSSVLLWFNINYPRFWTAFPMSTDQPRAWRVSPMTTNVVWMDSSTSNYHGLNSGTTCKCSTSKSVLFYIRPPLRSGKSSRTRPVFSSVDV